MKTSNKKIDLTGQKFGKLFVQSRAENNHRKQSMWNCVCDCGNEKLVLGYSLTSNKTRSCGCLRKESAHAFHFENLANQRFGKLTVISRAQNRNKCTMWHCQCDCGNTTIAGADVLKNGTTKSCGCLKYESKNFTHNHSSERLYDIWSKMKQRCISQINPAYKWYGARGISVCDEWLNNFQVFYDWAIKNGYSDKLTLDRINVNRNYEPSNCRWATMKEQQNNRRNNRLITYKGETKTITEWCKITGMSYSTLYGRIKAGYTPEECFEVPLCSMRGRRK